jgi:hypothetical protein
MSAGIKPGEYTMAELVALVAPVLGLDPADVVVAVVVVLHQDQQVRTVGPFMDPLLTIGLLAQGIDQVAWIACEASS